MNYYLGFGLGFIMAALLFGNTSRNREKICNKMVETDHAICLDRLKRN
jgi:hypothetical protein